MTTALDRTRALLDQPAPDPIPGQLDLTRSTVTQKPQHGDRVTVTTQKPTGGYGTQTGIYGDLGSPDRFLLDDQVLASGAFLSQHHGATRTVAAAPAA